MRNTCEQNVNASIGVRASRASNNIAQGGEFENLAVQQVIAHARNAYQIFTVDILFIQCLKMHAMFCVATDKDTASLCACVCFWCDT